MDWFPVAVLAVALVAGATASVVGFGIGSLLTGTLAGERLLLGLTPRRFSQVVAVAVGLLGVWMLVRAA